MKRRGSNKKFTKSEEQLLIEQWDKRTIKELAQMFNASRQRIVSKGAQLRGKGINLARHPKDESKDIKPIGSTFVNCQGETYVKHSDGAWRYKNKEVKIKTGKPTGYIYTSPKGYSKIKTETGWEYYRKEVKTIRTDYSKRPSSKPGPIERIREKKVRHIKPKKIVTSAIRSNKKALPEKKLVLTSTQTGGKWVRIDSKTLVYKKVS